MCRQVLRAHVLLPEGEVCEARMCMCRQVLRAHMLLPEGEACKTRLCMCRQVLRAHMLLPEGEVRELEALAARVAAADAAKADEEDILGEPPAEFLDALMDTLMDEPVILPKSRAIVDRSTINRCA
jgi:ubiquitin conjugation factor E4 B